MMNVQSFLQLGAVALHGFYADPEAEGDFPGAIAFGDEHKDFALPRREFLRETDFAMPARRRLGNGGLATVKRFNFEAREVPLKFAMRAKASSCHRSPNALPNGGQNPR